MPGFAVAQPSDDATDEATFAPGAQAAPVPFWDGVVATTQNDLANGQAGAREDYLDSAYMDRHLDVERRIGQRFDFAAQTGDADNPNSGIAGYIAGGADEADIERFRQKFPAQMAGVPTAAELRAQVDQQLQGFSQRAGVAAQQRPVTSFLTGAAAQLLDPINTSVGALGGEAFAGLPLAGRILAQSVLWGGLNAAEAPVRAAESQTVGGPAYGLSEALGDIAGGLAAGPIFEGGGAALHAVLGPLARRLFPAGISDAERVLTEEIAADPTVRGAANAVDAGLRDRAAVGPLRSGADFDAGVYSLQSDGPLPLPEQNADVTELFANPAPATPPLSQVGERVTQPNGATLYDQADYRGRPIYAASFDPAQMKTAPETFQYKADGDAQGVTARLRGVQAWDPTSSGKVIAYEAGDGGLYIADGHQRLALANRLANQGFAARLDGMLFKQADGWSPLEVRTVAALKNIREGAGTPLDAAKVFRAHPASLNDDSLPVSGGFIAQAKGLARLSPEAFGAVVNHVIPENYAAVIGELAGQRPDLHEGLVRLLHAGEPANLDEAHALVHEAMLDDWVRQQGAQSELFGESPAQSLAIGRAKLRAYLVRQLRGDTRLFGQLVKHADAIEAGGNTLARDSNEAALATNQAALEIIAKLGMRAGDVGEAMTEASRLISEGAKVADAGKGVLTRVRTLLKRGERLDLARAANLEPAAPGDGALARVEAFDAIGGKGQAAQIAPKPEEAALEAPTPAEPDRRARSERLLDSYFGRDDLGARRPSPVYAALDKDGWIVDWSKSKAALERSGRFDAESQSVEKIDALNWRDYFKPLIADRERRAGEVVAPETPLAAPEAAPEQGDLFGDIKGDEAESAALEHLKACAPGVG